jgi:hypothetical protein
MQEVKLRTNMAETPPTPGTHPDTGLYHTEHMPMSEDPAILAIREKQLASEPLSIAESMDAGRDTTVNAIGEYQLKPDHVYRAVGTEALEAYKAAGAVVGFGEEDEHIAGNNSGVDWYLGGAAPRYGNVILEAPASPDFFKPADNWGHNMAKDPKVRHMKSSGHANPVPMDVVRVLDNPES